MDIHALFNAPAAAIVLGGTFAATVLRCGVEDLRATTLALAGLPRRGFHADRVRADLAGQVTDIHQDGLLRARPRHYADSEIDEAAGALVERRSVAALLERHEAHKARRLAVSNRAVRTLAQGAELAPVFGLAGTLVSLSQLPADGLAQGAFTGAISMAVLTTLYGLLLANFVLAPLSRMVERHAQAEEKERQDVIDWLAWQVAPMCHETTVAEPLPPRPVSARSVAAKPRVAA